MVSLFSFFKFIKIVIKIFLTIEADTIDSLQHFVFGIVFPVGTRILDEFEIFKFLNRFYMRTTAKISEVTLSIGRNNYFIFIHSGNQVYLVWIIFKHFQSFSFRYFVPYNTFAIFGNLLHFFFNLCQIFISDRFVTKIYIIIETFRNYRTYPELGIWI